MRIEVCLIKRSVKGGWVGRWKVSRGVDINRPRERNGRALTRDSQATRGEARQMGQNFHQDSPVGCMPQECLSHPSSRRQPTTYPLSHHPPPPSILNRSSHQHIASSTLLPPPTHHLSLANSHPSRPHYHSNSMLIAIVTAANSHPSHPHYPHLANT